MKTLKTLKTKNLTDEATARQAIEFAIAMLERIPDCRPDITFVFSGMGSGWQGEHIWKAMVDMGAEPKVNIYRKDGQEPYVIESLKLEVGMVTVHIQRDRKPTPEELAVKEPKFRAHHKYQEYQCDTL